MPKRGLDDSTTLESYDLSKKGRYDSSKNLSAIIEKAFGQIAAAATLESSYPPGSEKREKYLKQFGEQMGLGLDQNGGASRSQSPSPRPAPAPAQNERWKMLPCSDLEGIDLTKCIVRKFLYFVIFSSVLKAVSATNAITGIIDVASGSCNPGFWEGAGISILGHAFANTSPWCQAWNNVVSLLYSAPGIYVLLAATVGLFINTRLMAQMSASTITRFVDELMNLIFMVPLSESQIRGLVAAIPELNTGAAYTDEDAVREFGDLLSRGSASSSSSRTPSARSSGRRGGGRRKSKSKSKSRSRSKSKKRKQSRSNSRSKSRTKKRKQSKRIKK
tara:strand:+ start:802 stop:1797 length:996 start_codon:yes stop_codon:yes gene_type:complete